MKRKGKRENDGASKDVPSFLAFLRRKRARSARNRREYLTVLANLTFGASRQGDLGGAATALVNGAFVDACRRGARLGDFRVAERGGPTRFFGGGRLRIGEPGPIIPLDKFAEEAARRVRRRFERRDGSGTRRFCRF